MKGIKFFHICIVLILLCSDNVYAQFKNTPSRFLDFNLYPVLTDVDSDSMFTLNTAAKLSNRFSYFSLLNLYNQSSDNSLKETIAITQSKTYDGKY